MNKWERERIFGYDFDHNVLSVQVGGVVEREMFLLFHTLACQLLELLELRAV